MKRRWVRFLLLGIAAWLLFLVATFPAAHAYRLVQERLDGVSLGGLDGTLWSGRAATVRIQGVRLNNLSWDVRLWPLLLGRMELALQLRDGELQLEGQLGRTLGGRLYLERLQGRLPVARVQELTPYRVPALQGSLQFDNLDLSLADGALQELTGSVLWNDAALTFGSPLELGGFQLRLQTEAGQITGMLQDSGGPLQAEGQLKLTPEGEYSFEGVFTPRDSRGELASKMGMLGRPTESGGYHLNYSGKLPLDGLLATAGDLPQ